MTEEDLKKLSKLVALDVCKSKNYVTDLNNFKEELKILDGIESDASLLIFPVQKETFLREDDEREENINYEEIVNLATSRKGSFIEVPVVINE